MLSAILCDTPVRNKKRAKVEKAASSEDPWHLVDQPWPIEEEDPWRFVAGGYNCHTSSR